MLDNVSDFNAPPRRKPCPLVRRLPKEMCRKKTHALPRAKLIILCFKIHDRAALGEQIDRSETVIVVRKTKKDARYVVLSAKVSASFKKNAIPLTAGKWNSSLVNETRDSMAFITPDGAALRRPALRNFRVITETNPEQLSLKLPSPLKQGLGDARRFEDGMNTGMHCRKSAAEIVAIIIRHSRKRVNLNCVPRTKRRVSAGIEF